MKKLVVVSGLLGLLISIGCAPNLASAVKVGDKENATWVFVNADKKDAQGIYRCRETEKGPVCTKAEMK